MTTWIITTLLISSISLVRALYTANGSPCVSKCNNGKASWWTDLVCADSDFDNTAKGQVYEQCMDCLGKSTFINSTYSDGNTDQYWFLFHMKYNQEYCLFNNSAPNSDPVQQCLKQCDNLSPVLNALWINSHPFMPQYAYCSQDSSIYPNNSTQCSTCLQANKGSVIIGNMVDTMVGACASKPFPKAGNVVQQDRNNIFDSSVIPTATPSSSSSSSHATSTGASTITSSSSSTASSSTTSEASHTSLVGVTTSIIAISSSPSETKSSDTQNHQLSTGAILAIGLTVGLLGIGAIVGTAVFFLLRHNKKQQARSASPSDGIALFEKPTKNDPIPDYSELDPHHHSQPSPSMYSNSVVSPMEYRPPIEKPTEAVRKSVYEMGDGSEMMVGNGNRNGNGVYEVGGGEGRHRIELEGSPVH